MEIVTRPTSLPIKWQTEVGLGMRLRLLVDQCECICVSLTGMAASN